ncbi:LysR family transcriptional regulator [Acinetobacter sp. AOR15_HL]|uniref:LysR family transcriptional regulator n=1 Tax=unclassified Acinetobacter TaxID=196816 RepID=UPI0022EAEEDC|nr:MULTISPECIES: LysR family transcriptional regulator [unclassified Acinetobacter]MDA3556908.1 LysR family transcriptional regulator [Acinetobacter sp. AOR15_HL]MDA3571466.1 LysR family transcriptional regulator [Acinetobacter sp. AOR14_HL]
MDKLDCINTFISVVESGNFSNASRNLGISRDQVSKRIFYLESLFSTSFFTRNTRKMDLTRSGEKFYQRCKVIVEELDLAANDFIYDQKYPEGILKINVPHAFIQTCFSDIISNFLIQYPNIEIDLLFSEKTIDINESKFDIVLKVEEDIKEENIFILDSYKINFYTTSAFLNKHGKPKNIEELRKHNILLYSGLDLKNKIINSRPQLICNNIEILLDLCKKNQSILFMPDFLAKKYEDDGVIINCSQDIFSSKLHFYATTPYGSKIPKKVELFLDSLKQHFSNYH